MESCSSWCGQWGNCLYWNDRNATNGPTGIVERRLGVTRTMVGHDRRFTGVLAGRSMGKYLLR